MQKVRIGFVGVGFMGQCAHLRNYVTLNDCKVVALAELRPRLGADVAERYNIPRAYRTHHEMIAEEKLDGIIASQPFWNHGGLLPDLFKVGIPVFTEKPLTCSVESGQAILKALSNSKARHYVGYHKRSDPATLRVKEEMMHPDSRNLGRLRYIRILMPSGDWIAGGDRFYTKTDEKVPPCEKDPLPSDMDAKTQKACQEFINYYIHQINLMRFLLNEDYSVTYADPSGVLMAVKSESGIPGVIEMSPYQTTLDWQESVFIAFERGYIKLELPAPLAVNRSGRVTIFQDPGKGAEPRTIIPELPPVHAMLQQAIQFIQAIKGEKTSLCEASDALKDLQTAEAYIRLRRLRR